MTRGRWLAVASALIVLAVVIIVVRVFVGSDGGPAARGEPPAHDPPAAFAVSRGVALPQHADGDPLPIVLHGLDAVIGTTDGLQVVDTRTGDVTREVPALADGAPGAAGATGAGSAAPSEAGPASPSVEGTAAAPAVPVAVPVAGHPAVAAAFPVGVAGHGTTVGHAGVQVLAVDAGSFEPVARLRIDLPPSLADTDRLRDAAVVGEDAGLLVIVVHQGADEVATTYAVDPVAGRVVWQRAGFDAAAVVDHRAVGAVSVTGSGGPGGVDAGARPGALRAADGVPAWTGAGAPARSVAVWRAGPALVAVTTTDAGTGTRTLAMLDAATGAVRLTRPSDGGVTCRFDERDVTVCGQGEAGQAWAVGFDASTGRQLWQLPDAAAGRVAPKVSAVWHGTLYGTTENGPVALDARTGADRAVLPGAAPALVDAWVGIGAATLSTPHPIAWPATS